MQLTRAAFAATNPANPTGQDEPQPQPTARYDDALECEKCGKNEWKIEFNHGWIFMECPCGEVYEFRANRNTKKIRDIIYI